MDKQQVYDFLRRLGLWFEVTDHPAVYNMDEMHQVDLPYPEADAKNLFIRDDKKQHYYLLTVRGDKWVDLKAFRKTFHTRPLTFASAENLRQILGLFPGSVSPLGILNDRENRVHVYLDQDFFPGLIGVHPNDNTATVWMKAQDLAFLIRNHGNDLTIAKL